MEEEEEEDEEEEDTEFPSEILFRFRLGTLLSFSAGKEGRHEVSKPCEWSLNAGIHPAAPTSPPAEHPPTVICCATTGDMGLASTTRHGAASFPQAPAKKIPQISESQTPALTELDIPQTSVHAGCFGAVKVPAVMTICPYIYIYLSAYMIYPYISAYIKFLLHLFLHQVAGMLFLARSPFST